MKQVRRISKMIIFILCMMECAIAYKIHKFIREKIPVFFETEVCTSQVCREDADYILSSLNTAVDPCDDFYEFACGGWVAKNPRPISEPIWGRWETIMRDMENTIRQILLYENRNDFTCLNKAKKMYTACLNSENFQINTVFLLNDLLSNYGGWPVTNRHWVPKNYNWLHTVAKVNSNLNVHPLINFHVSIDLYNSSKYQLYIDRPSFTFPKSVISNPSTYKRYLKSYELYIMKSALELIGGDDDAISLNEIRHDAYEIIKFEIKLNDIITDNESNDNLADMYKNITISHLQHLTDLVSMQNGGKTHWLDVFKILFRHTNISLNFHNHIIVKDLSYVLKLVRLMETTPVRIIANYIGWNVVRYFSKDATVNLRKYSFEMDQIVHGTSEDTSKTQYCMAIVNKYFGPAIAHKYIKEHFDQEIIQEIFDLANNIQAVLISKLNSLKWLDETTKTRAVDKANAIDAIIGYPEWLNNQTHVENMYSQISIGEYHILNILSCLQSFKRKELSKFYLSVDKSNERWSGIPTDINAYYNVLKNAIILPAGILQYPFFSRNRTQAINYGAIGTIIGHEFSHAFDNTGRQVDKNGNLIQWWTKESLNQYYDHLKCFKEHYKNYSYRIVNKKKKTEILVNDQKSQDENIADVIGLDLAYSAYMEMKNNKLKLPGLEKYSTEQYFFLSYANQWCENTSEEQFMASITDEDHIPNKIRVIGTLSNSEVFNQAFNCSVGSVMNSFKKCLIW